MSAVMDITRFSSPLAHDGTDEVAGAVLDDSVWDAHDDHPGLDPSTQFSVAEDLTSVDSESESVSSENSSDGTPDSAQIPIEIEDLESAPWTGHVGAGTSIHPRYKQILEKICIATCTTAEGELTIQRLPLVVERLKVVRLDLAYAEDSVLDMWAHALVVHSWQLCLFRCHTDSISLEQDQHLSRLCASYFLSAYAILDHCFSASRMEFEAAVNYWESALIAKADLKWVNSVLFKDVGYIDLETPRPHNEVSTRYIRTLEQNGVSILALEILDDEIGRRLPEGPKSPLHRLKRDTPEWNSTYTNLVAMLLSMKQEILISIIDGSLSRKAEIPFRDVSNALKKSKRRQSQPGTYINIPSDRQGYSPTPYQWLTICEQMTTYAALDHSGDGLAALVDKAVAANDEWPDRLASKGLRRYLDWDFRKQDDIRWRSEPRRDRLHEFVSALRTRCNREVNEGRRHAPLTAPIIEVGFSNDPRRRLSQHRNHSSSNCLMNLAEALLQYNWPGRYHLQQNIIYSCWSSSQCWLSEIFLTLLGQGYIQGAGGFSHCAAGCSNWGAYKGVSQFLRLQIEAKLTRS